MSSKPLESVCDSHWTGGSQSVEVNLNQTIESRLMDRTIDNLLQIPSAVLEFDEKRIEAERMLETKKKELNTLHAQLRKVNAELREHCEEETQNRRLFNLTSGSLRDSTRHGSQIKTELAELLRQSLSLDLQLKARTEEEERIDALHDSCRSRMSAYNLKMIERQQALSPIYAEIKSTQLAISALKKMSSDDAEAVDTEVVSGIKLEFDNMKTVFDQQEEEKCKKLEQVKEAEEKQEKLRRVIEMLNRRNAAQLTRLRHQVALICTHNQYRQDQVRSLNDSIKQLTRLSHSSR